MEAKDRSVGPTTGIIVAQPITAEEPELPARNWNVVNKLILIYGGLDFRITKTFLQDFDFTEDTDEEEEDGQYEK